MTISSRILAAQKYETLSRPSTQSGGECPYCGGTFPIGAEICPHCWHKLVPYCTFCGAYMEPGAAECPECGAPADGISCPKCGTKSFRAFCPVCNTPLTRAALKAVEKAKADPKFVRVLELVKQAEALNKQEGSQGQEITSDNSKPDLSEKEQPQNNKDVEPQIGEPESTQISAQREETVEEKPDETENPEPISSHKEKTLDELEIEINKLLSEMLPPAGSTPQQQRNFYCARKIEIVTSKTITKTRTVLDKETKERCGWICNLCGCMHSQPSECARPELGGRWLYNTKKTYKQEEYAETTTTKSYVDIKD